MSHAICVRQIRLGHQLFRVNQTYNLLTVGRVRHKECRKLMKHVLNPDDKRSHSQFDIVEIVYDFSMTRVAHAIKIACDNRKQKSYCVKADLHGTIFAYD